MGPRNQVFDPELLKAGLLLFVLATAIIVGVAVLKFLRRVYLDPEDNSGDVMEAIREAHRNGTMDDAEFQRVTEYLSRPVAAATEILSPPPTDAAEEVGT